MAAFGSFMRGLLDRVEEFVRAERTDLGRGKSPFDVSGDLAVREAGRERRRHPVCETLARGILHAQPADGICGFADDQAAVREPDGDAFALEIGVGPGRDLRIDQELLREGPRIGERRPRRDRARRDVGSHLARDLLVNRNRRIVLDVEHGICDRTGQGRPDQWASRSVV
ncbi:MAG TPA: hypothetical protein VHR72_11455 [Gemmataceae bacterium]|nr:hypothetical protein [Gemmataceae bacterium]